MFPSESVKLTYVLDAYFPDLDKEGMTVKVIDAMGRMLMQVKAEEDVLEFDAPEMVYFIRIE